MPWAIDASHASVDFAVRHLGISTVRGKFTKISGTVEESADGASLWGVDLTIDAGSIDTGEPQRDDHLRSPDFLDAARYPTIAFRSTRVTPQGAGRYLVTGDLSMRGATHPLTLEVETSSPITDPWGNTRAAASGAGKLNRKEWGLTWNKILELGALAVGDEVRFTFDAEAVAATPAKVG
jgi:polyisoprenoid-binding protein YceI